MIPCSIQSGGVASLTAGKRSSIGTLEPLELPPVAFRPDTQQFYSITSTENGVTAHPIVPNEAMMCWWLSERAKPNSETDARVALNNAFHEVAPDIRNQAARTYAVAVGVSLIREPSAAGRDDRVGAIQPRTI